MAGRVEWMTATETTVGLRTEQGTIVGVVLDCGSDCSVYLNGTEEELRELAARITSRIGAMR